MLNKLMHNSFFHITKRTDAPKWLVWAVRAGTIVVALLVSAIVSSILKPGTFGEFIKNVFVGNFGQSYQIIWLFQKAAILLLITLAVTPAFKMKFWNIGAEGQVLIGVMLSYTIGRYFGGKISDALLNPLMLVFAVLGGACWAVIPAIFKAKWNTNETLFTLMMNYIAMGLVSICKRVWLKNCQTTLPTLEYGLFPTIGGEEGIIDIIIIAVITVLVTIYLKYSKHGYELSVVGESQNTAKYIGISVPKVIIRTMLLSGALAGIAGWIIYAGGGGSLDEASAGGLGFTAILIAWLAGLNPGVGIFMAIIYQFFNAGSKFAGSAFGFGTAFPDIITAVFLFVVIASEFIVNYKINLSSSFLAVFKRKKVATESASPAPAALSVGIDGDKSGAENEEDKLSDGEVNE